MADRVRLPVLTNSQQKTYRRCSREHFHAYTLGYRSVIEAEALHYGGLIHAGLEPWWRGQGVEAAIDAMRPHALDDYEMARAEVALRGYDAMWFAEAEHYEVLGVECEFRAPLVNPETGAASRTFELGGKLDAIVRDKRDGLVKLVEHKTTTDDIGPGSDYWRALTLDSQISTYFAGARALGHQIAECIYDVIGKPALRPGSVPVTDEHGAKIVLDANGTRVRTQRGKWRETSDAAQGYVLQARPETADEYKLRLAEHVAENPRRYYQRGTVVRLEQEELDAAHDAWQTAQAIKDAARLNRWPRNADACKRFGRLCSYFGVCTGTASIDDPALFVRVDNVHPELSSEAA